MLALYRVDGRLTPFVLPTNAEYLREELGVDPSPELAELEERIPIMITLIHSREVVMTRCHCCLPTGFHSSMGNQPAAMQAIGPS
jgi:hypothetical protein